MRHLSCAISSEKSRCGALEFISFLTPAFFFSALPQWYKFTEEPDRAATEQAWTPPHPPHLLEAATTSSIFLL